MPPVFPFVVGCRRSGTTLLRSILDSHPDLAMPYEAHFVAPLGRRRRRYERGDGLDADRLVDDLYHDAEFRRMQLGRDEVRAALARDPIADYPEAVRRVFALYARHRGKSRYGDKMPGYVLRLPLLARLFPEGRFVHVVRDGRDVSLSLLDLWFAERGLGEAALFWRRRVTAGRGAGRRLGVQRYREVRYEDLIDDPEVSVRELCSFLELEFDDRMLRYFERGEALVAGTGYPDLHRRVALPPTKGLRDWRSQMSREDLELFEALAGDLLEDLGYPRAVPGLPLARRLEATLQRVHWEWHRGAFQVTRRAKRLHRRRGVIRPPAAR